MMREEGCPPLHAALQDTPIIQHLLTSPPPRYASRNHSLPSYASPAAGGGGGGGHLSYSACQAFMDILDIPTTHFGQQLTAMDNVGNVYV